MEQNTIIPLDVGDRIREVRESMDISREKFSEMIDISEVFLGQIERGERSLSLKTLCKIIKVTGASSDYILFGNISSNTTIDKINKLLYSSSDNNKEYIYQMVYHSNLLFDQLKDKD